MLICVSIIQIIMILINKYRLQPFIGTYKDNFSIITDVRLKTQLNKTKQLKEDY